MRKFVLGSALAAAAVLAVAAPASASSYVAVDSTTSTPTLITALTAGVTYHITATGASNLLAGSGLNFDAAGNPLGPIGSPYSSCYPNGCNADPTSGTYGVGGSSAKLGSLLGTFTASPTGPSDYFLLGSDYTFTALVDGSLFAQVNDVSAYSDNQIGTGFKVVAEVVGGETGTPGGVPEPATWALMISGFGMVGASLRRRAAKTTFA